MRRIAFGFSALTAFLLACSTSPAILDDSVQNDQAESGAPGAAKDGALAPSAATAPLPLPHAKSVSELCKLISKDGIDDPSGNDPQLGTNLRGTDLGIPVSNNGSLYFFFGDSAGYKGIWQFGESLPDVVGVANAADVGRDPSTLCTQLGFLHLAPNQSVGPGVDSRIAHDWAAVSMTPPPGEAIADYVHNPAGHGKFPNLTGDFEVPSGAFSVNGSIYVFYTTVDSAIQMKGSYLAKWAAPDPNGQPNLNILYHVDERFDANGAMRGDFINDAALVDGDYVYIYGTGAYRASPIQLARKKLTDIENRAVPFERFDATTATWKAQGEATAPIVTDPYVGELSVRYYPTIGRYMMLNQQGTPSSNQIVARFATKPEGPWSSAVVVSDMGDGAFRSKYCCAGESCAGQELMHCDRAGFYAPYLLPDVKTNADGTFTATFLMSTWDPYNVALMQATFE